MKKRKAQGLWNNPLKGADVFVPVDKQGKEITPTDVQVLKYLLSKLVRRKLAFFEIDKLEKQITRSELSEVVYNNMRLKFPNHEIGREQLKALMDALTNNPIAEPGMAIRISNGEILCCPGNDTRLLFDDGSFAVNAWRKPGYRSVGSITRYGAL